MTTLMPQRKFGWKPDLPDWRDQLLGVSRYRKMASAFALDPSILPSVRDQGQTSACTGFAIAGMVDTLQGHQQTTPTPTPTSPTFIYWNERSLEGTTTQDDGAFIRDGMKSLAKTGYCTEALCPQAQGVNTMPAERAYAEAAKNKVAAYTYKRLPRTLHSMKSCLFNLQPFVFGFTVYEGFMSEAVSNNGIAPLPGSTEAVVGGHAVCAVGWDDSKDSMLVRNSWGTGWGIKGYFWLPYEFFTNPGLSDDFWCIKRIPVL